MAEKKCSVEGCLRKHCAKGFCQKHYWRQRRNGTPEAYLAEGRDESLPTKYPGYSVSRAGAVYGKYRRLALRKGTLGYVQVSIGDGGKKKEVYVHRLVAEAFIPNPENKPEVNHKNGVRHDNQVENLEWVTAGENQLHSYVELGRKAPRGSAHSSSKPVEAVDPKTGEVVHRFSCGHEAGRAGFRENSVSMVCTGINKTHRGLIWRFTEGA